MKKEKTKTDKICNGLLLFIIFILLLRGFCINWFFVPSDSMYPGIQRNTYIFSNLLSYGLRVPLTDHYIIRWDEPQKGQIVTLNNPKEKETLVKRVMATGGDTIVFKDGHVFINGEEAQYTKITDTKNIHFEPGLHQEAYLEKWKDGQQEIVLKTLDNLKYNAGANNGRNAGEFKIPKGYIMAIGDNRDNSFDSRFKEIGLIPVNNVIGKVFY